MVIGPTVSARLRGASFRYGLWLLMCDFSGEPRNGCVLPTQEVRRPCLSQERVRELRTTAGQTPELPERRSNPAQLSVRLGGSEQDKGLPKQARSLSSVSSGLM